MNEPDNGKPSLSFDKGRLEILLADYAACRDDDRSLVAAQAAVFSVGVTILGLLAAAVSQTCASAPRQSGSCVRIPDVVLAGAPLLPFALFAYLLILGAASVLRGFYMRGLEEEIRSYALAPLSSLGAVWPASYMGIMTEMISMRRGWPIYRLMANAIFMAIVIVFGGLTAYIALNVTTPLRVAMIVIYGAGLILLGKATIEVTVGARTRFVRLASHFLIDPEAILPVITMTSTTPHAERRLSSYLAYPRPEDWSKLLFVPGVFLATAWSLGTLSNWRMMLPLWFVLEYLIYFARYQLNDLRGVKEDCLNDQSRSRGRLPIGAEGSDILRNVRASLLVVIARVVAALAIGILFHTTAAVIVLIALIFGTAAIYETLRSRQVLTKFPKASLNSLLIWLVVGVGYGVRAGLAFWIARLRLSSLTGVTGIVSFVFLGIMLALLTWALEAASYCQIDSTGTWYLTTKINTKAHVIGLLRYCGIGFQEDSDLPASKLTAGSTQRILVRRGDVRAPWNAALTVCVITGAILGAGLAHMHGEVMIPTLILSNLAGAIGMIASDNLRQRLAVFTAVSLTLIVIALVHTGRPQALLAVLPWLVAASNYVMFRHSSYRELKTFISSLTDQLATVLTGTVTGLVRLAVGGETWDSLKSARRTRSDVTKRRARDRREAQRRREMVIREALRMCARNAAHSGGAADTADAAAVHQASARDESADRGPVVPTQASGPDAANLPRPDPPHPQQ